MDQSIAGGSEHVEECVGFCGEGAEFVPNLLNSDGEVGGRTFRASDN